MFLLTNSQDARVTRGKLDKLIVEPEADIPNVTIQFFQGFLQGETFIPLGVDSVCFVGEDYDEFIQITEPNGPEAFLVSKLGGN